MSCVCLFSLAMVKIGPASHGEFNVFVSLFFFYATFHVFLVIVLVMYLTVTSINLILLLSMNNQRMLQ